MTLPHLEQTLVSTVIIFQNRAEAFKAIREKTVDPGARRLLEEIAADYKNLAETLTRIKEMQRVVSKRILL